MSQLDEGRGGARQRAIFSVDETQLPFELEVFDWDQAKASGLHIVLRKASTDHGSSEASGHELFDQRNAAKLHRDPQVVSEGIEDTLQGLPRRSGFGKDERDFGNFGQRDYLLARKWMACLKDQLQLVAKHAHNAQRAALYRQCNDSDVDSTCLDLLDDLAAEVPVHADAHRWILGVETLEHFRQHIQECRFVGADRQYATRLLGRMRQRVPGFVVQAQQALRVLQENFSSRSEAYGLPRTVKQPLLIIVFELTNLCTDRWLRAKYLGRSAREVAFLRHFDECLKVI